MAYRFEINIKIDYWGKRHNISPVFSIEIEPEKPVDIKDRLKHARKRAKLSQAELAVISKTSQQVISAIESGKTDSSGDLPAIAFALNISAEWLCLGKGSIDHAMPTISQSSMKWLSISASLDASRFSLLKAMELVDKADSKYTTKLAEVVALINELKEESLCKSKLTID